MAISSRIQRISKLLDRNSGLSSHLAGERICSSNSFLSDDTPHIPDHSASLNHNYHGGIFIDAGERGQEGCCENGEEYDGDRPQDGKGHGETWVSCWERNHRSGREYRRQARSNSAHLDNGTEANGKMWGLLRISKVKNSKCEKDEIATNAK